MRSPAVPVVWLRLLLLLLLLLLALCCSPATACTVVACPPPPLPPLNPCVELAYVPDVNDPGGGSCPCVLPFRPDGLTFAVDPDPCIKGQECQGGVISGGTPRECSAGGRPQDLPAGADLQCVDAENGVCTGSGDFVYPNCTYQLHPAGTPCQDFDACTPNSTCDGAGVCGGVTRLCPSGDPCRPAELCGAQNDYCYGYRTPAPAGTACAPALGVAGLCNGGRCDPLCQLPGEVCLPDVQVCVLEAGMAVCVCASGLSGDACQVVLPSAFGTVVLMYDLARSLLVALVLFSLVFALLLSAAVCMLYAMRVRSGSVMQQALPASAG
jgi:hypothetical protein